MDRLSVYINQHPWRFAAIFTLVSWALVLAAGAESIYPPFDPNTRTASLRIRTTETTSGQSVALYYAEGNQIACYTMAPGSTQDVQFQVAESTLATYVIGIAYTGTNCTGEVSDTSVNTATYPPSDTQPAKPEPPIIEVPPTEPEPPTSRVLSPEAQWVMDYFASTYGQVVIAGQNQYVHTPEQYQQTGMKAAIQAYDLHWDVWSNQSQTDKRIQDALTQRYILTLHWAWHFNGESPWVKERTNPVDVGAVVTPGTAEYAQAIIEIDRAASTLLQFRDAHVPILWRPIGELGGGWFWVTDVEHPENTVALYRLLYDRMVNHWGLNNLIWVFNLAGVSSNTEANLKWYPGDEYVDIVSFDTYLYDHNSPDPQWWNAYNGFEASFPGKLPALMESGALPNGDLTASGLMPKWLYALAWWGTPKFGGQFGGRPNVAQARINMRHPIYVTLDELPAFGPGDVNIRPVTGILSPVNDGTARYPEGQVVLEAYAVDRDGTVAKVELYADGVPVQTLTEPPYVFYWTPEPDSYMVNVVATDNAGGTMMSNKLQVLAGVVDAALGKPVVVSESQFPDTRPPSAVVDGDYYSYWSSGNSDDQWIYVDLEAPTVVNAVNFLWSWKIFPQAFTVEVATANPELPESWTQVHSEAWTDSQVHQGIYENVHFLKTHHIKFSPVEARYVRLHMTDRLLNSTWGGYGMAAFEVPVPAGGPAR